MLEEQPKFIAGQYDKNGRWQRTKLCLVYCGKDRCNCGPPNGLEYDARRYFSLQKFFKWWEVISWNEKSEVEKLLTSIFENNGEEHELQKR